MVKYAGSRKHVLDWVEQPNFVRELISVIGLFSLVVDKHDAWMPLGYGQPREARLKSFGPQHLSGIIDWQKIEDWWLVHKRNANTPNWDLVTTCTINDISGIVFVEAKANVSELRSSGKILKTGASDNSRENHAHIGDAIEEARTALSCTFPAIRISRDTHYQLSNRIAFSWKLASMGLPVVLVYLGFTGDEGIAYVGKPLRDEQHWTEVFLEYSEPVVPRSMWYRPIDCGCAEMHMIIRSRSILSHSKSV